MSLSIFHPSIFHEHNSSFLFSFLFPVFVPFPPTHNPRVVGRHPLTFHINGWWIIVCLLSSWYPGVSAPSNYESATTYTLTDVVAAVTDDGVTSMCTIGGVDMVGPSWVACWEGGRTWLGVGRDGRDVTTVQWGIMESLQLAHDERCLWNNILRKERGQINSSFIKLSEGSRP